jgi:hypothetical protein
MPTAEELRENPILILGVCKTTRYYDGEFDTLADGIVQLNDIDGMIRTQPGSTMIWIRNSKNHHLIPTTTSDQAAAGMALTLIILALRPKYANVYGIHIKFMICKDKKTGVIKYGLIMSMIKSSTYVKPTKAPPLMLDDFVTSLPSDFAPSTTSTTKKQSQKQKKQHQQKKAHEHAKPAISLDDIYNAGADVSKPHYYTTAEIDALYDDEPTTPVQDDEPTSPLPIDKSVDPLSTVPIDEPTPPLPDDKPTPPLPDDAPINKSTSPLHDDKPIDEPTPPLSDDAPIDEPTSPVPTSKKSKKSKNKKSKNKPIPESTPDAIVESIMKPIPTAVFRNSLSEELGNYQPLYLTVPLSTSPISPSFLADSPLPIPTSPLPLATSPASPTPASPTPTSPLPLATPTSPTSPTPTSPLPTSLPTSAPIVQPKKKGNKKKKK